MIVFIGDKDMVQLVSKYVMLINIMNDSVMDCEGVIEKFGIFLECIVDFLILVGDSVDNILGVFKCGFKIVVKWLIEYELLDNLVEYVDEIKGKVGENLCNSLLYILLFK